MELLSHHETWEQNSLSKNFSTLRKGFDEKGLQSCSTYKKNSTMLSYVGQISGVRCHEHHRYWQVFIWVLFWTQASFSSKQENVFGIFFFGRNIQFHSFRNFKVLTVVKRENYQTKEKTQQNFTKLLVKN